MAFEFSRVLPHSGLARWSPNGLFLSTTEKYRILVRDAKSLEIVHTFTCMDSISKVEWSNDSMFLLAAMNKKAVVQVWSLERPNWQCRIEEGSAGLTCVCSFMVIFLELLGSIFE